MISNNIMVFSKEKHGNNYVAKNFRVKEFACQDKSDPIFISAELVEVLQDVRDYFGRAVSINSAYRNPTHNKKVGGVVNSYHLYGMAADIVVSGVPARNVYNYLCGKYPDKYGIGRYETFTHIDVRPIFSRWKN